MTTILPTTEPSKARPDRLSAGGADSDRDQARWKRLRVAVPILVVVVIGGGFLLIRSAGSGAGDGELQAFTVTRRSFPVLLREKGELKAAKSVDVKCEVEGRSTIIWLIEEGKEVKEGEVLVRLASDQIDEKVRSEEIKDANAQAAVAAAEKEHEILVDQNASDVRKAELVLEMARIEMEKYLEGDWKQMTLDLDLELERAQMVLARSKADLEDAEELHASKFITGGELYNAQFEEFRAKIDVDKAFLRKKIEWEYTHKKNMREKQADDDEAGKELERVRKSTAAREAKSAAELDAKRAEAGLTRERLTKFREQQAKCEIRAPQDGLVVYESEGHGWRGDRQITEGAEVYERQTILKLPDTSVMMVTVRIHEAKTDKIALGQQALVEIEGVPGQVFTGKVTKIAALADSQNQWLNPELKEYETEITLDQNDAPLKPGVTARADIVVRQAEGVLAVPVQSVFGKGGRNFVFRKTRGGGEPVEVEPGVSSDEFVEIASGLSEGDAILLAVSNDLQRTLPEVAPGSEQVNGLPPQRAGMPPSAQAPGGGTRRPPQGQRGGTGHGRQGRPAAGTSQHSASGRPGAGESKPATPGKPDGAAKRPAPPTPKPDDTAKQPATSEGQADATADTDANAKPKPTDTTQ
ncbi:MAG TPA: efflux RND transporter periplasmic adaptor subunit [Phycisphaerae bacterium]|nr:efflux RND transporter periplasmic adaptor subunit [Phycisphaerae bacterium]